MKNKKIFKRICKECNGNGVLTNSLNDKIKCPICDGEGVIGNVYRKNSNFRK